LTAEALRDAIVKCAAAVSGADPSECRLDGDGVICGSGRISLQDLYRAGSERGFVFDVARRAYLAPRSVAFNAHGVRLAVHRITGEIAILHSVHAADIGTVINPMQAAGQIEGGIAQGFGWVLYEKMVYDEHGAMINPALRNYRIPAFADTPRTELTFASTHDAIGPLGAKSQGECCINPVAPAVANAVANATGVRIADLPLTPDRVMEHLPVQLMI
jgi:CO/xanthine dehydrogenase Mo-binding subunit